MNFTSKTDIESLRWTRHVIFQEEERLSKNILHGQPDIGCRLHERQKLQFKETTRDFGLQSFDIFVDLWEKSALHASNNVYSFMLLSCFPSKSKNQFIIVRNSGVGYDNGLQLP